jgi:hypothetical protein
MAYLTSSSVCTNLIYRRRIGKRFRLTEYESGTRQRPGQYFPVGIAHLTASRVVSFEPPTFRSSGPRPTGCFRDVYGVEFGPGMSATIFGNDVEKSDA